MARKRELVLTDTTCEILENIRLVIEVITRAPIRFKRFKFEKSLESGQAQFFHNGELYEVVFLAHNSDRYHLRVNDNWYIARFDNPFEARVIDRETGNGPHMWIIGTSYHDIRREALEF